MGLGGLEDLEDFVITRFLLFPPDLHSFAHAGMLERGT